MSRKPTSCSSRTARCVALSLVHSLIALTATSWAAANNPTAIHAVPEETVPPIPGQGGPDWIVEDHHPDNKENATLPNAATERGVDLNFEGFGIDENLTENGESVFIPPSPIGAAGPDRLIAVVNSMIEIRTKGGHLKAREGLHDFFAPTTPLTLTFDAKVLYDHYAGRFVVLTLEQVTGAATIDPGNISRILLAVSRDAMPDSLTADDWWFHAIDAKTVIAAPSPPRDRWAHHPGLELDEEAIYITANMFSFVPFGLSGGVRLWIVDKGLGSGGFYDGGPASTTKHDPYAGGGIVTTTMPALVFGDGGVGGPGSSLGTFLVSYSGLTDGLDEYVQVVSVSDPLGRSGGPTFVQEFLRIGDIESFPPGGLPNAPQLGSTALIAVNDRRALDATWRDNSLWFTATIQPNAGPDLGQTTAHWWKLDTSGGPGHITLADHGNIGGEDIALGTYTFFPSVAVNSLGDAIFGFSASAPTIYAGAYAAGREIGDPAGTVQSYLTVKAGEDSYLQPLGRRVPWGDYSGIAVDPEEIDKFWIFNAFADTRRTPMNDGTQGGRWGTAWARAKFLKD